MKLINKKTERQKEKDRILDNERKQYEANIKKREENSKHKIKIILDWRLAGEYNQLMNGKVVFAHEEQLEKNNFLKYVIDNRKDLNEIINEGYDPGLESFHNTVEIETDKETIEILSKEARELGLGFDEYIRGLFYTTAYKSNQEKDSKRLEREKVLKERELYPIKASYISKELKRKLENKYGKPERNFLFGIDSSEYTNMLINLAEEYFNMKSVIK